MFAHMASRSYGGSLARVAFKCLSNVNSSRTPKLLSRCQLGAFPRREYQQKRNGSSADATLARNIWNKLFGKYLLATNILSSGILMVIGDLIAQEIEYRRHKIESVDFDIKHDRYDTNRIWRMFIVGALQGPLHHYVYKWMDHVMPVANMRNTLQKILIDQVIMSPACILIFFYSACYLEQRSVEETNTELCDKFPIIYLMDWTVWPVAQYVNFRYLDTKYRVMFVNVCTALYNIFLSYMKHDF
ncbi:mpv17-like protein 2 [Rhagoletis pomonella]|uniref:mpv17-like protein 2 n=1 Tax=Rhagoletis pomonella TaxID=28610 RepID=UPI001782C6EE|nr:mpv17-like protein 2 [Rhagoletis pomonella]